MEDIKKEVSFRFATLEPKVYDLFLFRPEEEGVEIHFANKTDDEENPSITIENIIRIPKKEMQNFLIQYAYALQEYEGKYNNGYGLNWSMQNPSSKKKGKK